MSDCTICGEDSGCHVCSLVRLALASGLGGDDIDVVIIPAMVTASSGHFHLCSGHNAMFAEAHKTLGAQSKFYARPAAGEVS